jgi:tetratricopeptide (TPR) repeat protein
MSSSANTERERNRSALSWVAAHLRHVFFRIRYFQSQCTIALFHKLGLISYLVAWLHKIALRYHARAESAYKLILRLRTDDRDATFMLAHLFEVKAMPNASIFIFDNWIKRFPNDAEAHVKLSKYYSMMSETAKAKEHLEIASGLAPNTADVLEAFGYFHRWNGNLDESSRFFILALKEQQKPSTLFFLSENLIDERKEEEAMGLLVQALQFAPDFGGLYLSLALCGYYRELSHPHIVYIKYGLEKRELHPMTRSAFHFTLGTIYEKLGLWNEAFVQFKAGNDINWSCRQHQFRLKDLTENMYQLIEVFNSEFLGSLQVRGDGRLGESLIFIVGMPRSGSTLVEQILASHPDVFAGGERQDLCIIIGQLCSELNEPYPSCIRRLDRQVLETLGNQYMERVSDLFDGYARFVDKQLSNYMHIGLITAIFPKAKVIHCQRDALDTCVSGFCKNLFFSPFTQNLKIAGIVYRQYERLMSHWHSVLPGRILDVQYEEMVSDPETQIRRLLAHCELSWHPECLNPYKTKRPVNTASATQVNSPINTRSIGRWKNYEKHLGPLINALSDSGGRS